MQDTHLWYVVGGIVAVILVLAAVILVRARAKKAKPPTREIPSARVPAQVLKPEVVKTEPEPVPAPAVDQRLTQGLSKTRGSLLAKLGQLLGHGGAGQLPSEEWSLIEEALLEGDVGIRTTELLLDRVKNRMKAGAGSNLKSLMVQESQDLISGLPHGAPNLETAPKPYVISVVGVNGAGKTTTIGKLAQRFIETGHTVLLGAGDTFRAAAISQLKVWADRVGAQFVTGREGGDPGAVAFDSVTAGKARGVDVVILDTAGRLHTKSNLMEELKKVNRVVKKVIPEAPHEVWLVVDGTTGQNAIRQAQEFQKTLEVTGVVVTKLDGTAKGGAILAVASELKLPIKFIGIGESAADLIPFEPKPFIEAILG